MRISTRWPNIKWYWALGGALLLVLLVASIMIWRRAIPTQQPAIINEELPPYEPYIRQFADSESGIALSMAMNSEFTEALARLDGHLSSGELTNLERAWLLQARASVLLLSGDIQSALTAELSATELAPDLPILYTTVASIYGDYLGDRAKAKEYADDGMDKYLDWGRCHPFYNFAFFQNEQVRFSN